jgi:hypothetical protein
MSRADEREPRDDASAAVLERQGGEDRLATEMRITFEQHELLDFFDGFAPLALPIDV